MREKHLIVRHIELTVRSPLFVGSGNSIMKKEYYFDSRSSTITVFNMEKLLRILAAHGLADEYERYILHNAYDSMADFLRACSITREALSAKLYQCSVADALDYSHSLKEIKQFIRTPSGLPYIPGSGLKGALRTALLCSLTDNNTTRAKLRHREDISSIEASLLNTVPLGGKEFDETHSIMSGVRISDSEPTDNANIILAKKIDVSTTGVMKTPNLVRECLRPGTRLRFALTIDCSVTELTPERLTAAIAEYSALYKNLYLPHFTPPHGSASVNYDGCMVLGGGSGYFGKNIIYPALGYDAGLERVSDIMARPFSKHGHTRDTELGISPHMMKYTLYQGQYYPIGLCRVEIAE